MIGDTVTALLSRLEGASGMRDEIERVRIELNRLQGIGGKPVPQFGALLNDQELVAAAASFDFTNIPQTYKHLMLMGNLRGNTAATSVDNYLRINNVSSANYYDERVGAIAASPSAAENIGATVAFAGRSAAATATANLTGKVFILIPDYQETVRMPGGIYLNFYQIALTSGNVVIIAGGFTLNVAGAINRITLTPSAGNWDIGSRLTLYGLG